MNECERKDQGKNRMGLISPIILWELGLVYTYGSTKYADRNWEKAASYTQFANCALRHLTKWMAGHEIDEESELHHLGHAIWNLGALLHFEKLPEKYGHFDDRAKYCAAAIPNDSGALPDAAMEGREPDEDDEIFAYQFEQECKRPMASDLLDEDESE